VADVSESVGTYRVVYERDESGWWIARAPTVYGCHTHGRTVEEARRRIREALGLFVDDAESATLTDAVRLPATARQAVSMYQRLRQRVATEERRAARAALTAVNVLRAGPLKLSARDAGHILGLSHQRVHQLAQAATAPAHDRTRAKKPRRDAAATRRPERSRR